MTEKKQPSPTEDDISNRVSLRRIATAISRKRPHASVGGKDRLLQHLRSGRLTAGFHSPGDQAVWVSIPSQYWQSFPSKEWSKIQFKPSKHQAWIGSVTVPASEFASQFVLARTGPSSLKLGVENAAQILKDFMLLANKRFEVEVLESEWIKFSETERIRDEDPIIGKSSGSKVENRGTKEHLGWGKIAPVMAAYFATEKPFKGGRKKNDGEIAQEILDATAKLHPGQPLPERDTLKKVVGDAVRISRQMQE